MRQCSLGSDVTLHVDEGFTSCVMCLPDYDNTLIEQSLHAFYKKLRIYFLVCCLRGEV